MTQKTTLGVFARSIATALFAVLAALPTVAQAPTPQENAIKQATIELERVGALVIRDLRKNFAIEEKRATELKKRLDEISAAYVKKNPPPVLDWGAPPPIDFEMILAMPEWTETLEKTLDKRELESYRAFLAERKKKLDDARRDLIRAVAAAEFSLTTEQRKALDPICDRLAKRNLDAEGSWNGPNIVGRIMTTDAEGDRILTPTQTKYFGGGRGRTAMNDIILEAERIRLVTQLPEPKARVLRAAGEKVAREMRAEATEKAEAEAKKKAEAKKAEGENTDEKPESPEEVEPKDEPRGVDHALWKKIRDSIIDPAQREAIAKDAPVTFDAVKEARAALALVQLEHLLHLDAAQIEKIKPLVTKEVKRRTIRGSQLFMFSLDCFGLKNPTNQYYFRAENDPKARAAQRALEDILDRDQIDALKDQIQL